ncbi:hypothetical protein [Catenibacillus scindens]|uniref:hypothetical protein n=1 Tax=Catenibacillus scindens TaxID=673271 RepID=UPI0032082596
MTEFEQKQLEHLKRIADALESIEDSFSGLAKCIRYIPPRGGYTQSEGYYVLQIVGSVNTEA